MKELSDGRIGDWVIYKNNQLIGFNKPPALAVQQDKTEDKSLHQLAEIYCKSRLFLIHRLDRPASGAILFAKSKSALVSLNAQFQGRSLKKTYLAVVKNRPPEKEGVLIHFLLKNQKLNQTISFEKEEAGTKKAELKYKLIGSIENYHLLEIDLTTGRHHQIRAQLAAIGCPIKGDVKYGFKRRNKNRSIHLHAWKLAFHHPVSGEQVELVATPPKEVVWDAFFENS